VIGEGNTAMGLSNQTSFLRPVTEGAIHASARARHRGRTTWVWEVEAVDDAERLCALSRITVAIRPAPAEPPASPSGP
jgi:1,4-dihydroxy-2-naphthoyl-CoA hydrolase